MNMKLADMMREALEARREFKKFEPHVRAGIIMVKLLRAYLMVRINQVDDITEIRYDLGNRVVGNLVQILSEAKITPSEARGERFRRMFAQYVNDSMLEEGIAVKWIPHELAFSFAEHGNEEEEE